MLVGSCSHSCPSRAAIGHHSWHPEGLSPGRKMYAYASSKGSSSCPSCAKSGQSGKGSNYCLGHGEPQTGLERFLGTSGKTWRQGLLSRENRAGEYGPAGERTKDEPGVQPRAPSASQARGTGPRGPGLMTTRAALQLPLSCCYLISSMAIKGQLSSEEAPALRSSKPKYHKNTAPRRGKGNAGQEIQIILGMLFLTMLGP